MGDILNVHAPLQYKKTKLSKLPSLTKKLKESILNGDSLKRKAVITKSETNLSNYKCARNKVNVEIREAKSNYYRRSVADQKLSSKIFREKKRISWKKQRTSVLQMSWS